MKIKVNNSFVISLMKQSKNEKFNDFVSNSLKQNYEIISILTLFIKPFFGQILKGNADFTLRTI